MSSLKTVEQAAAALGLAVTTLNKWRVTGRGPDFIKLGGAVRYSEEALEAFKTQCQRRSTSQAVA
jgi:predicted site-specific integrase-resolvase